jgi:hypothetical protein
VYIAAHALDAGESEGDNGKKLPNSTKAVVKTADDFLFLIPSEFFADFAADLPRGPCVLSRLRRRSRWEPQGGPRKTSL